MATDERRGRIPDEVVAEVKARADIVAVVSARWPIDKQGTRYVGHCPFHDDAHPSFYVVPKLNRWFCTPCGKDGSGDSIAFVMRKDGLDFHQAVRRLANELGIEVDVGPSAERKPETVAIYKYLDAAGVQVGVKRRIEPGPDGKSKSFTWTRECDPWTPVLYRLPDVISAVSDGETVFVVEGEKCVDRLAALGMVATCNEDGAGKFTAEHAEYLRGGRIAILADNDEIGKKHAEQVRLLLDGVAREVAIVELPKLRHKGDVFDWLDAGHKPAELADLAADALFEAEMDKARRDLLLRIGGIKNRRSRPAGKSALDLVRAPRIGVDWLVRGLLTRSAVGLTGAESKGTKTWMGAEVMVALSSGTPVFGQFEVVKPAWSLAFFLEDGIGNLQSRLGALVSGRRMDQERALGRIRYESRERIDLNDNDDVAWIIASARAMPEPPEFIYIDPLRDAHHGEENSSDDMSAVMGRLRDIRSITGATVWTPHHMGKPSKERAGQRLAHRLRGSTAIHGAVDCGIYMETKAHGSSDDHAWWKNVVDVELRDGIGAGTFGLELDVVIERGAAVTAGWAFHRDPAAVDGKEPGKADREREESQTVLGVLRRAYMNEAGPLGKPAIADATGFSETTVKRRLDLLVANFQAKALGKRGWEYLPNSNGADQADA